jgi:hypothetical protein
VLHRPPGGGNQRIREYNIFCVYTSSLQIVCGKQYLQGRTGVDLGSALTINILRALHSTEQPLEAAYHNLKSQSRVLAVISDTRLP